MINSFSEKLIDLVGAESDASKNDAKRKDAMFEELCQALAIAAAIASDGIPEILDNILVGCEGCIYDYAVEHLASVRKLKSFP